MSSTASLWLEGRTATRRRGRTPLCTEAERDMAEACRSGGAPTGGRLTLGQVLDGVWEGLHAGGAAECPVCRGSMGATEVTGVARCGECGTALS